MEREQEIERLPLKEKRIFQTIYKQTVKKNKDNITRTNAYLQFYKEHHEIHWSFVASMVSRNAGWNMCDLEGTLFSKLLDKKTRETIFLTYERANWTIFQDAFPQLLIYHYSCVEKTPLFHLLKYFYVSSFMYNEWNYFWHNKDYNRLLFSLIINEQHVIHKPVICHPFYQKKVFHSIIFILQDLLHFSSVLLPTCNGNLYGACVSGFKKINNRIELGKKIASILFHQELYPFFYEFAVSTNHTGSRYDYEQFFMLKKYTDTPTLRSVYPIIQHHIHEYEDWSTEKIILKKWYQEIREPNLNSYIEWFYKKRNQLHKIVLLKQLISPNNKLK